MPREMVGLRLSPEGLTIIDEMATQSGASRSTAIRVILGEALRNQTIKQTSLTKLLAMKENM